jgi:hypothetical protein
MRNVYANLVIALLLAVATLTLRTSIPPAAAGGLGQPMVAITEVPPPGGGPSTLRRIAGVMSGADPRQTRVVIYALTDKWYIQPFTGVLTSINNQGKWSNRTHLGNVYAALLVHRTYVPPATTTQLPALGGAVLAIAAVPAGSRTILFSGRGWWVKGSDAPVGPGPNVFSDRKSNVAVDKAGRLRLRITRRKNRWECAEVVSQQSFGYGEYRWVLDSSVAELDPNVVLGLFTWSDDPAFGHREIDIEFSRWSDPANQNAQYVITPFAGTPPERIHRFQMPPALAPSTHLFRWSSDQVVAVSAVGALAGEPAGSSVIEQHTFTAGIPQAGGENARINLWLFQGAAPSDGQTVEVIVRRFEFAP